MREEIVPDENAQEDKVVDHTLEVESGPSSPKHSSSFSFPFSLLFLLVRGDPHPIEFAMNEGPQPRHLDEDILLLFPLLLPLEFLGAQVPFVPVPEADGALVRHRLFDAEDTEVRFVRCQREHDEVCVFSDDYMGGVRVVAGEGSLPPDVLHDLMLALARHARV